MSTATRVPWQRLLALLLCMAMVVSFLPATAWATELDDAFAEPVTEPLEVQANENAFTILAASDFQERGATYDEANANGAANVAAILEEVKEDGHSVDGLFFCGDYSLTANDQAATNAAHTALNNTLIVNGLDDESRKVFVQGNHEPAGLGYIAATGGYEKDEYAYFVLNEDDWSFGGGTESGVRTLAASLESWLSGLTVGEKPVFILSHVPLHYSMRTYNAGDALYASYLVDVLNEAGQRGLNIIFLFGHNHSGGYDAYLGGSTSYVGKGDILWVANPGSSLAAPVAETINFTYMNAGYVGYYEATTGVDSAKTMSVFEIVGDDVTIYRYDANGVHGVKPYSGHWAGTDSRELGYGYEPNTRIFAAGVGVEGNDLELTISQVAGIGTLRAGFHNVISVAAREGYSYSWTSENPDIATVTAGDNGTATIHAAAPGVVKITVTEHSTVSAEENAVMTDGMQAEATASASVYITVAENVVEVQDGMYYTLATELKEGQRYMLVNGILEGKAFAMKAAGDGPTVMAPTTVPVTVSSYNSFVPFVLRPTTESDNAILWDCRNLNASVGICNIQNAQYPGTNLGVGTIAGDWTAVQFGGSYQGWKYDTKNGLRSDYVHNGQELILTRYLNGGDDHWAVVVGNRYDPKFYSKVYLYEQRPLTYTLSLSDRDGQISVGGTVTDTKIVKTWSTGEAEYFDLTTEHLSVGSAKAGTYQNVTVTYGGHVLSTDFTLTVGASPYTIQVPEGYYYRLTDHFEKGANFDAERKIQYLILNRNTRGDGRLMEAQEYGGSNVVSTMIPVSLDADGIPAVRSDSLNQDPVLQEWWYHKHSDGNWYLWQPNWSGNPDNYLRIAAMGVGVVVGGGVDPHALTNPAVVASSSLAGYTTVRGNLPVDNNGQYYLQYRESDNQFVGVSGGESYLGSEVYAYEKVFYNTAEVSALGSVGAVLKGSGANAQTGTHVLITYPDGHVDTVPVTVNMLYQGSTQLTAADVADGHVLTGLTLKYQGITLATDYILKINTAGAEPEFPDPGSVRVDKDKDTTEYNYEETGVARVDLSVSGVPMGKPVDVLLIVDTSASVEMYRMANGKTRIQAMREATEALIEELSHPNADGSLPDISLAISEFNNYTYFAAGNTFNSYDEDGDGDVETYEPYPAKNLNANGLVQDYTSIYEMQNFNTARLTPKSGTNYDVAFQKAYEIVSARKKAYPEREQIVIFMTDGICYQYNYMSYYDNKGTSALWNRWLEGKLTEAELAEGGPLPDIARVHFYNRDQNKHWMAEAIKGSPEKAHKVIWNPNTTVIDGYNYSDENNLKYVKGLGATMYSIGFGVYVDGEDAVRISDQILSNVASDPYKYFKAEETQDLMAAFADIGHGVRKAATNAEFYDQMGEEFNLQMKPVIDCQGDAISKKPAITVKSYDVYKYGEIGTVVGGVTVTEQMVGKRKSNVPTILETVTFNDDGTEAYSSKKSGNIMVNGIIDAFYFMYNTTEYDPDEFYFGTPGPETFLWNIGDITERELVLSYYVYLEDSMGENGGHTAGVYDTNQYAELHYLNYLGDPRIRQTTSPKLNWETARVNYGFYLVNENGQIINQDGSVTSFENKFVVGALSKDQNIHLNTNNTVTPQHITLADGTVIDATLAIPEGYELFVKNPSATIRTNSGDNTGGRWDVDVSGTTYLDNGSTAVNADGTTKTGEYDDTTVWFALVYTGSNAPMTNKTVEATDDPNEFVLTLEAYAQGVQSTVTVANPADIVLVLDHSASMRTPVGAPQVLKSGTWYGGEGQLTKAELDTTLGAHPGYYIAQNKADNYWYVLLYHTDNKWYGYKVNSTEGVIEYLYKNGTEAQKAGKYADHLDRLSWNSTSALPDSFVFYRTQYAVLYEAVKDFIEDLKDSGMNHRVAITGFCGSTFGGTILYGTDYGDLHFSTVYGKTADIQKLLFQQALKDIQNDSQYAALQSAVEAIDTRYIFTCPTAGLRMGADLFKANPVNQEERDRVMILFTDGIPNKKIGGNQNTNDDQTEIYNEIIAIAKEAKDQEAKVYAISTTTLSAGVDRSFLHYASSDYPNATNFSNPGSPIENQKYTMRAENMEDFGKIFNTITQEVVGNHVALDKDAVLREVLTDYFVLNPDDQVDVQVYTAAYNGDGTYAAPVEHTKDFTVKLLPEAGGRKDTIEVSGFDYANEYISSIPRTVNGKNYYGSKLIVKVRIKTRDGFWGGNNVPTNKPATGIYDKNRVLVEDFPEPQVNVPIHVEVTAKDRTVYYGDDLDANKDGWKGDELLERITVGTQTGVNGQIVNGSTVSVTTVTNPDGSTTTTFVPEQSWMDDYATMDWTDGSTEIKSELSSTQPGDYTYGVEVNPNSDGSRNNSENPGTTDNIAGSPTEGDRASDTGHIFVKVPELTFKDSVTEFGTPTEGYDYAHKDYVDTKWVFMADKNTENAPTPTTDAPELKLTYTPEEGVTQFVGDTKVDVDVSRADGKGTNIQNVTTFKWDECGHEEHGSCGAIGEHKADADNVHEFWVHTDIAILPDTVVIDFGLPVDIDPLTNDLYGVPDVTKKLNGIGSDFQTSKDFTYGAAEILEGNQWVRYSLHTSNGMQMNKEETFKYQGTYTIKGRDYIKDSTITVIPATIIYYEDTFVTYTGNGTDWTAVGTLNSIQDTDRPGADQIGKDLNNIYGYDSHYVNENGYSMDTYHKITVSESGYGKATFTFTGTAFDVIALSSNTTGTITVSVYPAGKEQIRDNRLCNYVVDTYYGYKPVLAKILYTYTYNEQTEVWYWKEEVIEEYPGGATRSPAQFPENPTEGATVEGIDYIWVITDPTNPNALYQVPVMKVDMADHVSENNGYGTYTAVITVAYNDMFDHEQYGEKGYKYDFMLDAIRIYDQANDGKDNPVIENAYKADGEGWPTYTELRNILINTNTFDSLGVDGDVAKGVVFIDGIPELSDDTATGAPSDVTDNVTGKTAAIVDYANFGPNNELYLAPGQGISFALNGQDGIANVKNVHLALKSVGGTSQVVICGVKEDNTLDFVAGSLSSYMEVKTATDLYYDITKVKGCKAIVIYNPNNPANGAPHSILSITNLKLTHAEDPANKGTVQPTVSREMASVVLNALKPEPVNPFADIFKGDYYYDPILWAVENGITKGVDASRFGPAAVCNRAQVVTFLWRAAGCPEPNASKHPFVDVEVGSFYYKAMLWAVEKGITNGVDATHFDPHGQCNRAQVVTFLWRAKGCPEPELREHPFTDVEEGSFYHKATLWAVENNITSGMSANSFAPALTCTRGQVVTFLYRAYEK